MSDTIFITTFAKEHIDLYGKRFIDSFNKYNSHLPLHVYAEDFDKTDLSNHYKLSDFNKTIPLHKTFLEHIRMLQIGLLTKPKNRLEKALRWSYKSFTIIHALENSSCKYVVWIDADVETVGHFAKNSTSKINHENLCTVYQQYIDRELHIESGLIIFNLHHPSIINIINHYKKGYQKYQVLDLDKPWDGFWLGKYCKTSKDPINYVSPPFSNVKGIFKHHVGKDKFRNTDHNKFSGRKI